MALVFLLLTQFFLNYGLSSYLSYGYSVAYKDYSFEYDRESRKMKTFLKHTLIFRKIYSDKEKINKALSNLFSKRIFSTGFKVLG
jgi:hypothetical protein